MDTYRRWPVRFTEGSGASLFDTDGRRYVDLVAGIAVASVGHAHPVVVQAISQQSARLMHVSNLYETDPAERLAERLQALSGMRSFFCNSGAEAVEAAIKLARLWGAGRGIDEPAIVAAEGGFHGRTFGALAATGQPAKRDRFAPMLQGFGHVPYGDTGALESAMGPRVAAVLLEAVQGEAGVVVPPAGYLEEVREMCDRWGALLIIDEVQTGLGRTGRWFGYQHADIEPDVVCLAKALGGGLPIGACLARPEVAELFVHGDHGSTFGGGLVQCSAALAVLDVIEDQSLIERSALLGASLKLDLQVIFGASAVVRGLGLMIGIEFDVPIARRVAERCLERGVLVNDATPYVCRLTPPLVIGAEELSIATSALGEVWDEIAAA
jgi:acetylornithine aminotransferase